MNENLVLGNFSVLCIDINGSIHTTTKILVFASLNSSSMLAVFKEMLRFKLDIHKKVRCGIKKIVNGFKKKRGEGKKRE